MKKKAIKLLRALSEAHGAPGNETAVREIFQDQLPGPFSSDRTGSICCTLPGTKEAPRIMLAAHLDEIGFAVQNITADGFIRITPLGGWWSHTLLSQRVRILTSSGKEVIGVIASTPVHFLPQAARNKVIPLDKMLVDVGAKDKAQVTGKLGISLGDPIVPDVPFTQMANPDIAMGKAFDNRVGVATAILATQALAGKAHPNSLFSVGTAQEEVGVRGATTAARLVKPDLCLVLEGPPADDAPGFNRAESQGKLGAGVQLRLLDPTAIMNRGLTDFIQKVAKQSKIPLQIAVRSSGGTDARAVHLSDIGVPTAVLGVPARYIHNHNGLVDVNDLIAAVKLVTVLVHRLDQKVVKGFTDFVTKKNK